MPLLGDIRRFFSRKKQPVAIELDTPAIRDIAGPSDGEATNSAAVIETRPVRFRSTDEPPRSDDETLRMRNIREQLDRQTERTERLLAALEPLPEFARHNARLLETLAGQLTQAEAREESLNTALERLTQAAGQQIDVLGLVQQQLDSNREVETRILDALASVPSTLAELAQSGQRTGELLSDISGAAEQHTMQSLSSLRRLQYWMIASLLLGCVISATALIIAVLAMTKNT